MKPILYHFERVKDLFGIYRSSCNTTMNKQLGRHAPSNSQKIKFFEGLVPSKMNVHNPCKQIKIVEGVLDLPANPAQMWWSRAKRCDLSHGQSSYWTAKSSFLFLASDHTEADPNYTLGVDFWNMIFYNLKNSG